MIIDIDELCFISECKTYLALVNYYQKQSDMMQYSDTFIMEASSKSSFKDKLNKLKEGFMYIIRKFVQRIRIIIRKISRTKMGRGIKKAFDGMKEKHYRKKYNLPKQDGHIKDATKHRGSGHEGLTKDMVKQYINVENQTLKSWLFLYDDVDERVEIQMEFLTALDEVLDKYLHDKTYSLEMAVKELDDKTDIDGDHASGYRAYYFSHGWYNTTDLRLSDKGLAEDIEYHGGDEFCRKVAEHRHIDKCRDIPFSEYIQKFQKLEADMDKIDKLATKVSGILDDILHSTKYKDDIVMGLGGSDSNHYKHGTGGDWYQYTSFDWQGTKDRYNLTHHGPNKRDKSDGKDKTGKNFDSYHFKELTGPLMYFQNYMNSMYYFMKIEYEAILEVSGDIDGGVADE